MSENNNVIFSALKLARAMRRCPPEPMDVPLPPAAGRLISIIGENEGISSRELCERMDIRPSSLSEMLARAQKEELVLRTPDEADKRVQHLSLTEKSRVMVERMRQKREEDANKKTACFTEEEKAAFCALADRLSTHLEGLANDDPRPMPPHCGHHIPMPEGGPFPPMPFGAPPHHGGPRPPMTPPPFAPDGPMEEGF